MERREEGRVDTTSCRNTCVCMTIITANRVTALRSSSRTDNSRWIDDEVDMDMIQQKVMVFVSSDIRLSKNVDDRDFLHSPRPRAVCHSRRLACCCRWAPRAVRWNSAAAAERVESSRFPLASKSNTCLDLIDHAGPEWRKTAPPPPCRSIDRSTVGLPFIAFSCYLAHNGSE